MMDGQIAWDTGWLLVGQSIMLTETGVRGAVFFLKPGINAAYVIVTIFRMIWRKAGPHQKLHNSRQST